jgi:excisionase family DNA binding protein
VVSETGWLSTNEACERLGVTLRTLYRLVDEGQIPGYKIGRLIRLKADEVDAFVEGARIQPGDLKHLYPSETSETEAAGT